MADIKIKRTNTAGDYIEETTVEVTGMEYGTDELTKAVLDKLSRAEKPERETSEEPTDESEDAKEPVEPEECGLNRMRSIHHGYISPERLKAAIEENRLDSLIQPFTEIDIPLDTGGMVTVVCGYSGKNTARFVFKDCWDEAVMNEENTNKTGYFKSKGQAHVLVDILPHIAQEWRAIFKPRHIVENIGGETVEYDDLMWLPSATDVFGPSEEGYWNDEGENFQLPIFEKERDRVKEFWDEGTYPYWLRSVAASGTATFRFVTTDGNCSGANAYASLGFAPGFDI